MRLTLIALCLLANTAVAETFTLSLGNRSVGTMTLTSESLTLSVTDSPMGVANGTFTASSKRVRMADGRTARQYLSDTPRKGRKISVLHDAGQVIDTTVSPASDATDMSQAAAVPGGVTDFIQALNTITRASTCPGGMRLYEGRRVVTLTPLGSTSTDGTQSCDYSYRVTGGPGHLSPLSIRNASIELTYADGALTQMTAGSGPFTVTVTP